MDATHSPSCSSQVPGPTALLSYRAVSCDLALIFAVGDERQRILI